MSTRKIRKDAVHLPAESTRIDPTQDQAAPLDQTSDYPWTLAVAEDALHHVNPAIDREQWRKVVSGMMTQFGKTPEVKTLADRWSRGEFHGGQPPENHDIGRNERQWDGFEPGHVSIGRLFQLAVEGGWDFARWRKQKAEDDGMILVGMDDSRTIAGQVWARIMEQERTNSTVFRYGRQIARLDSEIEVLTKDSFWQLLATRLSFCRVSGKRRFSCDPPPTLITYILNTPPKGIPLPELMGVTRTPVMAADGTVHSESGYSPISKLFHFPSVDVGHIPEEPTPEQVQAARRLLEEVVCDFPFVHPSDRAHALSLMVLPFVRPMISGPTPIYLINKPTQGTGATLLGEAITLIKSGEPLTAANAPKTEEEWQKTIVAKLLLFPDFFFIDNITRIKSEALATALTTSGYEGRRLGASEMVRVPVRCTWIMTGNNPELSADFPRRVVQVRLDANMDDPSQGREFRHKNLKEWVGAERGRIIAAILTLARAWVVAARPLPEVTLASFEDWAAVVGGILQTAGIEGFLNTPEERKHFDDPWQQIEREFVSCWLSHGIKDWQRFRKVKSRVLFGMAERCELQIGDGLRGHEHGQLTQFGMKLGRMRDKTFILRAIDRLPSEPAPEIKVKVVRVGPGGDAWWCLEADESQIRGLDCGMFWTGPTWD